MIKLNIKWLDLGVPLFIITYINLSLFFTSHMKPSINNSVNKLLNTITNNYWDKVINNINNTTLINIFDLYSVIIFVCLIIFITSIIFYNLKFTNTPDRIQHTFTWLIVLLIHQFNILLLLNYNNIEKFNSNTRLLFLSLDITIFFIFTFLFLNSYDKENNADT